MKTLTWAFLSLSPLLASSGCSEKNSVTPAGQTCDNERLLETYQDREAMVIKAGVYCLTVAPEDLLDGNYRTENVLVPVTPLPAAYQTVGLRVRVSGRKKSCYGLTTSPNFRHSFGYKFELDKIDGGK